MLDFCWSDCRFGSSKMLAPDWLRTFYPISQDVLVFLTNQEPAFWSSQTWNLTNKNPAFGWLYNIRGGRLLFVPCQKNLLTNWPTNWRTDWHANELTDWMNDWQTEFITDWLTDWLTDWHIDWLTEYLTYWLTDWLADWLTRWLIDWLND